MAVSLLAVVPHLIIDKQVQLTLCVQQQKP